MGTLRRICAKVREPSELRFGVVRGVDRGIGVLDGGPRRARKRRGFFMGKGVSSPIFTIGFLIAAAISQHPSSKPAAFGLFLQLRSA